MAESISWLHLSDLHFGQSQTGWLWPRIKNELYKDINKLASKHGGWDLVFFTGDFVQTGHQSEFDQLNYELEAIWQVLAKHGHEPLLCAVPGNHDLVRPSPDAAVTKTLAKLWLQDESLRHKFWTDDGCEYREATRSHFDTYTKWLAQAPVPVLQSKLGKLPGDFSGVFEKGDFKLGIVGLNTTFLQISGEQNAGCLDVHVSQLASVCDGDPDAWAKGKSACVLLTHQPVKWLCPEGQDHFRREIYPPERFFAHYCGHLHEPEAHELSEAGAAPRRTRQAPSLFGLESFADGSKNRIHGFNSGHFVFDQHSTFERLWPRIGINARHGGMHIAPDHSYSLGEDDFMVTAMERGGESKPSPENVRQTIGLGGTVDLLTGTVDKSGAVKQLEALPRLAFKMARHHQMVRLDEQTACEHELRKKHSVWLTADWGAGHEGFLASVLSRFETDDAKVSPFLLKCADAADVESFEAQFPQQFGMPMQKFCLLAAEVGLPFLILDGLHPNLASGKPFDDICRVIGAMVDYCAGLRIVTISRLSPPDGTLASIVLAPLDAPDVRTYVLRHTHSTPELDDPEAIEQLRELSEGLPMHLDRLLKALGVATLSAVVQAERDGRAVSSPSEVPPSLVHTVSRLSASDDRRTMRSLRLLEVLTVLPYGETLDWLGHFLPTEPFFLDNALQLQELALLEVAPLQQTDVQARAGGKQETPKLLKVPKQVRDYVQTLLTPEVRKEIILAGLNRFCGREWKEGRIKLRTLPFEYREYLGSGAGNEFALIQQLMGYARDLGDSKLLSKSADLAVFYATHLEAASRWRDLCFVAGAFVGLLDPETECLEWSKLQGLYGQALRMLGKHEPALESLRAALDKGADSLTPLEQSSIWLDIALAEQSSDNKHLAVTAAREVIARTKDNKPAHLHAQLILADLELKNGALKKRLEDIERQAKRLGFTSLVNTIALKLALLTDSTGSKIKHFDRVLNSDEPMHDYNKARAIVSKAEALGAQGNSAQLNSQDLSALSFAYSYFHSQRLGSLFDRCHEQLWVALQARKQLPQLYRLFKHSSFIWRIKGEADKEESYLRRLEILKNDNGNTDQGKAGGVFSEITYFLKRLTVVIRPASN